MRIALVCLVFAACQSKSTPPATGSGTAATQPSGSAPPQPSTDIPKLSGKAAAKTTKPHTKDHLEKLSKLEFPGFDRDVRKLDEGFLNVKHQSKKRPRTGLTVTILPCNPKQCLPLKADTWRAEKEALMVTLAPELRDKPDTTFEIGEAILGGERLIYVYQLGMFIGKDAVGNMQGAYTHSYVLYHHDGVNLIRVVTEHVDDPAATKADLAKVIPRQRLEDLGTAVLDTYAQAWAN